jgi:hypothetical protein
MCLKRANQSVFGAESGDTDTAVHEYLKSVNQEKLKKI